MLDLIRNVHQYETYDLKNQEHTLSIMNEVADEIISDLSWSKDRFQQAE